MVCNNVTQGVISLLVRVDELFSVRDFQTEKGSLP